MDGFVLAPSRPKNADTTKHAVQQQNSYVQNIIDIHIDHYIIQKPIG